MCKVADISFITMLVPDPCKSYCQLAGHSSGSCEEDKCQCSTEPVSKYFCSEEHSTDPEDRRKACATYCHFKGKQTGNSSLAPLTKLFSTFLWPQPQQPRMLASMDDAWPSFVPFFPFHLQTFSLLARERYQSEREEYKWPYFSNLSGQITVKDFGFRNANLISI